MQVINPHIALLNKKAGGETNNSSFLVSFYQQTWLCGAITVPTLKKRHVGIARLKHSCNLGKNAEEVRFLILILCPGEVKQTKSALETARTFATLFSDVGLRYDLTKVSTVPEFKEIIKSTTTMFAEHQQPHFGKKLNGVAENYGDEKGLSDGSDGDDGDDEIKVI